MKLSCLTPSIIETYLTQVIKKDVDKEEGEQVIFRLKRDGEVITYYKWTQSVVVNGKGDPDFLEKDLNRLNPLLATKRPKVFIDHAFKNSQFKNRVKKIVTDMGFEALVLEEQENHSQVLLAKLEKLIAKADYGLSC